MPLLRILNPVILVVFGSLLAACGGSSGGGGAAPAGGNPPPATQTTITAANAPAISGSVYTAVFSIDDVASLTNPLAAGGGATVDAKSQSSVAAIDPGGEIENCLIDGRISLTVAQTVIDHIIAGMLASGDTFGFGFEMCEDEPGLIIDGNFDITVRSFSGDILTDLYMLDADLDMNNMAVTFANETDTINADMRMVLDLLSPSIAAMTISGGSIDEQTSTGDSTSMSDFSIATIIDESSADVLIETTGSGALMSSDFDGEVMFNITVTFRSINDENPFEGTLLITGANGSSITLEALDALTARITIDLGDGSAAIIQDILWIDLLD